MDFILKIEDIYNETVLSVKGSACLSFTGQYQSPFDLFNSKEGKRRTSERKLGMEKEEERHKRKREEGKKEGGKNNIKETKERRNLPSTREESYRQKGEN